MLVWILHIVSDKKSSQTSLGQKRNPLFPWEFGDKTISVTSGGLICRHGWVVAWTGQCRWENSLLSFPESKGPCRAGPPREAWDLARRREEANHSPYWGFAGKARQGRVTSLGLASLNDSSGLWGTAAVPRCLISGPVLIWVTETMVLCVWIR